MGVGREAIERMVERGNLANDLYTELQQKRRELDACIRQLRHTGAEFAAADRAYNIAKRACCLRLKAEGMPIGLIEKVYKGEPEVADARYRMMCDEAIYKANCEAVMSTKLQLRLIDTQLGREWSDGQADM